MKNFFIFMLMFGVSIGLNMGCGVKRAPSPLYSTPLPFEEDNSIPRPLSSPSPSTTPIKAKTR